MIWSSEERTKALPLDWVVFSPLLSTVYDGGRSAKLRAYEFI